MIKEVKTACFVRRKYRVEYRRLKAPVKQAFLNKLNMKKVLLIIIAVCILLVVYYDIGKRWSKAKEDANSWWSQVKEETYSRVGDNVPGNPQVHITNYRELYQDLLGYNGERKYILLLENSMEARPSGGFIGAFMEITVKDGRVADKKLFDSGVFDRETASKAKPNLDLYQIYMTSSYLGTKDSNYFFDFRHSAESFLEIYGGEVEGVAGITSDVLPVLIDKTGPVTLEGVEGEFTKDNVLEKLEYEVEAGYKEKGIPKDQRKEVLEELVNVIIQRLEEADGIKKLVLLAELKKMLDQGSITLYAREIRAQEKIEGLGWGGRIKETEGDYLAVVDTNLYALKTNRCLEKKITYELNTDEKPLKAKVTVKYTNTCEKKDFMTGNYKGFTQFYVPQGSVLVNGSGFEKEEIARLLKGEEMLAGEEEGRISWGNIVSVPLQQEAEYTLSYILPESITKDDYSFLYQHQSGAGELELVFKLTGKEENVIYNQRVKENVTIDNVSGENTESKFPDL